MYSKYDNQLHIILVW